jgi:hypothetical protein
VLCWRAELNVARSTVGVGRSTAYRWWHARFEALRVEGGPVRGAARALRLSPARARRWEAERRQTMVRAAGERDALSRRGSPTRRWEWEAQ